MRRALIACIHGNLIALEAVLKDIAAEGVDEIVCLGDIMGYGPDVVECVDLVREKCAWSLCGNHEAGLFLEIPRYVLRGSARKVLEWQSNLLKPVWHSGAMIRTRWKWLKSLPVKKTDDHVLFVHGSPADPLMGWALESDFNRPDGKYNHKATAAFEFSEQLCFCAHTHVPGIVKFGENWLFPQNLENGRAPLDRVARTLVNVGSVGQPRDKDSRSSYVIWDDERREVVFHRVPYNLDDAIQHFKRVPALDERLWWRLREGY